MLQPFTGVVPLNTALSSFKCHFYKAAHTAYRGRRNTAVVKKKKSKCSGRRGRRMYCTKTGEDPVPGIHTLLRFSSIFDGIFMRKDVFSFLVTQANFSTSQKARSCRIDQLHSKVRNNFVIWGVIGLLVMRPFSWHYKNPLLDLRNVGYKLIRIE